MAQENKPLKNLSIITSIMAIVSTLAFVGFLYCTPQIIEYAIRQMRGFSGSGLFAGLEALVVIYYAVITAIVMLPYAILGFIAAKQCGKLKNLSNSSIIVRKLNVFIASNIFLFVSSILPMTFWRQGALIELSVTAIIITLIILFFMYIIRPKKREITTPMVQNIKKSLYIFGTIDALLFIGILVYFAQL